MLQEIKDALAGDTGVAGVGERVHTLITGKSVTTYLVNVRGVVLQFMIDTNPTEEEKAALLNQIQTAVRQT